MKHFMSYSIILLFFALQAQENQSFQSALSYRYTGAQSIGQFQSFFDKTASEWIKNKDTAWQETIKTLEREENAQKKQKFVAYHAMPASIFFMLSLYTTLYNEQYNIKNKEHFIYLRTFDSIKDGKNNDVFSVFKTIVEENQKNSQPLDWSEKGRKHLISLSPFLLANRPGESALGRKVPNYIQTMVLKNITHDIATMYSISHDAFKNEIVQLYKKFFDKRLMLQIIFSHDEKTKYSLDKLKQKAEKIDLDTAHVGYDKNNIFPHLYWSLNFGIPSYKTNIDTNYDVPKSYDDTTNYDGATLFNNLLHKNAISTKDLNQTQLRLIVIPDLLEKQKYSIYPVDLMGTMLEWQKQQTQLVQDVKSIIKKYNKSSSLKT